MNRKLLELYIYHAKINTQTNMYKRGFTKLLR